MKIRRDLVTNSSSSSFVIAYKEINEDKRNKIEKIVNFVNEETTTTKGVIISSKEELKQNILKCWGEKDETIQNFWNIVMRYNLAPYYNNLLRYINKGYRILEKEIDFCEDEFAEKVRNMEDKENFIIIEEDI